ncbi:hypothetical protein [Flammeovirga sp. SJP92]|uniref:hypothetical protein n=1 Tax=Flammeovirga sp. SJP92 TaxID=1775430 RepID=UPI00078825D2|nr:hypothetical protein [Flammeovirga sp. SJP92]KXX67002.1 hypothetical protein AVL50_28935 [Flammeovirga sp. SJP92]
MMKLIVILLFLNFSYLSQVSFAQTETISVNKKVLSFLLSKSENKSNNMCFGSNCMKVFKIDNIYFSDKINAYVPYVTQGKGLIDKSQTKVQIKASGIVYTFDGSTNYSTQGVTVNDLTFETTISGGITEIRDQYGTSYKMAYNMDLYGGDDGYHYFPLVINLSTTLILKDKPEVSKSGN